MIESFPIIMYNHSRGDYMEKNYVVYKVTNLINGKMYVGKTYNFEKRKREHFYDIDNGLPFHRALKKYGVDNFKWEIIDTATSEEDVKKKEIAWIKELRTCIHEKDSNGYNITLGGEGGTSWNSRPIVMFDLNGIYVDEFISCACAAAILGFDRRSISRACDEEYASSQGYQWRYKDEWNGLPIGKFVKKESCRKVSVIQLDMNGYLLGLFDSITNASNVTKIPRENIS